MIELQSVLPLASFGQMVPLVGNTSGSTLDNWQLSVSNRKHVAIHVKIRLHQSKGMIISGLYDNCLVSVIFERPNHPWQLVPGDNILTAVTSDTRRTPVAFEKRSFAVPLCYNAEVNMFPCIMQLLTLVRWKWGKFLLNWSLFEILVLFLILSLVLSFSLVLFYHYFKL